MLHRLFKKRKKTFKCNEGELYTIPNKGQYGIIKILKVKPKGIHVCMYSNLYFDKPSNIDESQLFINTTSKNSSSTLVGTCHSPLTHVNIKRWNPEFLQKSIVEEHELEGYYMWENSNQHYI